MNGQYTVLKDKPKEFFRLIPQTGVTHLHCTEDPKHNAVWDMAISPEGRVFFSACGESYVPLYARLYEYDHTNKKMIRHLALEDEIIMSPSALCTSKFHTAMSFVGGNRILTTTHTTSPGPKHPTWMPYEYADHPYEGYQGSHLIVYNYLTGETKGLGVISPHDTTYGGCYDPKNGDYLVITWMRGVGYVYNIHTGEHRCLGQISDAHTSRLFLCSDGHIYGSTYSGAMFRYNTDIRQIEFLGVEAPGLIRHARERDGVLYFTTGPCSVPGRGQILYGYHLKNRAITEIGRAVPKLASLGDDPSCFFNAYGMAFDSRGRLWYGCQTFIPHHRYVGARLYMWDFLNGKAPVDCGFLGTPKRTLSITAEVHCVNDVLYISDGNHTSDIDTPCGILAIDLDRFEPALETEERIYSHDYVNYFPYQAEAKQWYPKDDFAACMERYDKHYTDVILRFEKFLADNAYRYPFKKSCGVSVWQTVGHGNTKVKHIKWTSNDTFSFWTGDASIHRIDCVVEGNGNAHVQTIERDKLPVYSELKAQVPPCKLPGVPGRQYLSVPEASVLLPEGGVFVGTGEATVARIDDGRVFCFGQVCSSGGVHSLDIAPDGTVWGVAGHEEGVGQLFTYTGNGGITLLGMLPEAFAENGRNVCIFRPTTLAVSPDGKYLVVGGADEMAGLIVITI